uniref:uncharacterized protein isoform X2 n=1 Tax=Myxine glutinosa TaxID=7769 RepID=UPI00358F00BB
MANLSKDLLIPLMFFTWTVDAASGNFSKILTSSKTTTTSTTTPKAAAQDSDIPVWGKALLGLMSATLLLVLLLVAFVALYCLMNKAKKKEQLGLQQCHRGRETNTQPQGIHKESDIYTDVESLAGLENKGKMQHQKPQQPISHPGRNTQPEDHRPYNDSYIYVEEPSLANKVEMQLQEVEESQPDGKRLQSNTQPEEYEDLDDLQVYTDVESLAGLESIKGKMQHQKPQQPISHPRRNTQPEDHGPYNDSHIYVEEPSLANKEEMPLQEVEESQPDGKRLQSNTQPEEYEDLSDFQVYTDVK